MKDKTEVIKGALGDYDFIWVDEGKNLIVGNNWTQGLLETINGYLDDGRIFKRLAKGEVKYWTKCNFGTGTFFFGKLKLAVLSTGLFQRILFTYKNYDKNDVIRISNKYDDLAQKDYMIDLQPVFEKLKKLHNELNFDKYLIGNPEHKNYAIKFNINTSRKFGKLIDDFFNEFVFEQVGDKRLQDILTSFLIRSKELGHRIMCTYAVWNGYDIINDNCINFAFEIIKELLGYTLDFVSNVFEGNKFDTDDLNKEDIKNKKIINTKRIILKVINENPGITKSEFRTYVQTHRNLFEVGELRIVQEILPSLILQDKIYTEIGSYHESKLFVKK
jgi:hypothetical protein